MPNPILKHAVVIGAGLGGLAAAKAVAPLFEKVIVLDRDAHRPRAQARPDQPEAKAQAEAKAKRDAERFAENVADAADALGAGSIRLPSPSALCWTAATVVSRGKPRVTAVTIYPLGSLSVEELVRKGLVDDRGFNRRVFETLVKASFDGTRNWVRNQCGAD
jgi:threonine dehydrogenase-like Zn-dependent dehydrogenase